MQHPPKLFSLRFVQVLDRTSEATRAAHLVRVDTDHVHRAVNVAPQVVPAPKQYPARTTFLVIPMYLPQLPVLYDLDDGYRCAGQGLMHWASPGRTAG